MWLLYRVLTLSLTPPPTASQSASMPASAPAEVLVADMLGTRYTSREVLARVWAQRQWPTLALAILLVGALLVRGTAEKRRASDAMAAVKGSKEDRVYVPIE